MIVGRAALVRTLLAMVLPAAERTTQVLSPSTTRIHGKSNSTVRAVSDTGLQRGIGSEDRVERDLILPDKRVNAIVEVPILTKREKPLDQDDKKARFSVTILSLLFTPSCYFIDAKASRGNARCFCARDQECKKRIIAIAPTEIHFEIR